MGDTSDNWTLLDEFRYQAGEGNIDATELLLKCVEQKTWPKDWEPDTTGNFPYSIHSLVGNSTDSETGNTPLHYACANGHLEMTQWLVDTMKHPWTSNQNGNTPLHYAVENSHENVVKYLCQELNTHVDVNAINSNGQSLTSLAENNNHQSILAILENHASFRTQDASFDDDTPSVEDGALAEAKIIDPL